MRFVALMSPGSRFVCLRLEDLTGDDVLGIVDTLADREISVSIELPDAQQLASDINVLVTQELAEKGIRDALGSGRPEEM